MVIVALDVVLCWSALHFKCGRGDTSPSLSSFLYCTDALQGTGIWHCFIDCVLVLKSTDLIQLVPLKVQSSVPNLSEEAFKCLQEYFSFFRGTISSKKQRHFKSRRFLLKSCFLNCLVIINSV